MPNSKRKKPLPTADRIRELFDYDRDTGFFYRKSSKHCPWLVGKRSGSVTKKGYRLLHIDGVYYLEHRIAWLLCNGPIPEGFSVDHIDSNKANNAIGNLRLATECENCYHRPRKSDNKTGLKGVYKRENGKFRAAITINKKRTSLGTFATKEEAYAAYCEAAIRLHGEFAQLQ